VAIKASNKNWNSGKVNLILPQGDSTIFLTWLNDTYEEGEYDANIMIKSIMLKKVAESSFTAYLMGTNAGNRMMIVGTLIILMTIIGGISLWNRKKVMVKVKEE